MKIVKKKIFTCFEDLYYHIREHELHHNIYHIHHNKVTNEWQLFYWFEGGGIVTGAAATLIGEAGAEVIFPSSKLNEFTIKHK